ncbi:MAG: sensor histidine kinase N-terminal domain-containing protein, partial [Terriglobales bacterium]
MSRFNRITRSIRTELLCWLVIPILVLLSVGVALNYGLAISMATDAYDKALIDSVYCISRCVQERNGKISVDLPPAALEILRDDVSDKVYYQVVDKDLNLISGDKMPPITFSPELTEESSDCRDGTIGGEQVRIAVADISLPNDPKTKVYIQVGETMHQREHIAGRILVGVVVPQLIILSLSVLLVWFGVRRGLTPLNNVKEAVASRSPADLRPLQVDNVPREVRPLVAAINELLERLEHDLHAQRRFVANA